MIYKCLHHLRSTLNRIESLSTAIFCTDHSRLHVQALVCNFSTPLTSMEVNVMYLSILSELMNHCYSSRECSSRYARWGCIQGAIGSQAINRVAATISDLATLLPKITGCGKIRHSEKHVCRDECSLAFNMKLSYNDNRQLIKRGTRGTSKTSVFYLKKNPIPALIISPERLIRF